jgi:hypothetical protein
MSGNGSLSGSNFKEGSVLPTETTTATQPVPTLLNSKLGGEKKKHSKSLRSSRNSRLVSTYKLYGGKGRKSRKYRRKSKKCKSMWSI